MTTNQRLYSIAKKMFPVGDACCSKKTAIEKEQMKYVTDMLDRFKAFEPERIESSLIELEKLIKEWR